jgi:hypothetical protein
MTRPWGGLLQVKRPMAGGGIRARRGLVNLPALPKHALTSMSGPR